jgi:glycosyltransferase involved in cell wall biosynthesis
MLWFAGEIWPRILEAEPRASLCIAGSFPPPEIEALSGPSIMVTGAISDDALRQIYQSTQVVIVPLRFGAGVKGKVMEAASFGRPIVSTSVGVQGLAGAENFVAIADTAEAFAEAVIGALREPDLRTGKALAGLDFVSATASEEATRLVFAADIPELNKAPDRERKPGTAG